MGKDRLSSEALKVRLTPCLLWMVCERGPKEFRATQALQDLKAPLGLQDRESQECQENQDLLDLGAIQELENLVCRAYQENPEDLV